MPGVPPRGSRLIDATGDNITLSVWMMSRITDEPGLLSLYDRLVLDWAAKELVNCLRKDLGLPPFDNPFPPEPIDPPTE